MKTVRCAWCGKEYQLKAHQLARKIREGTPTCCSQSCGLLLSGHMKKTARERAAKESAHEIWKRGYSEGYQQAILDGAK